MATKLDGFVFNGTEYEIQDTTAREQIAAQLASRTEVDADYAAEVIDARVGDDGTIHPSLGEAIRQQYATLANALELATKSRFKDKTFSILGDGTTTFQGYLPTDCITWYTGSNADVEVVGDTFWGKLIAKTGMALIVNNSWDGSKLTYDGDNANSFMAGDARIHKLGNTAPDYLFVVCGKDDIEDGTTLGEFTPELVDLDSIQDTDLSTLATAYKIMIQKLMTKFPNTKIVVLWYHNMSSCPAEATDYNTQYKFAEVVEKTAKFYGCQWIDLRKCGITMANNSSLDVTNYPTKNGHELYYQYIIQELR